MSRFFKDIKKFFNYTVFSSKAELKSEVAGSFLSWLWWILDPFFFMLVYSFIAILVFKSGEPYFRATDKAKLKAIYDQINQLEKSKVEVTEHVTYHEQYLLWALAGLLLLFAEFLFANLVLKRIP
jgi:hypothetical protein